MGQNYSNQQQQHSDMATDFVVGLQVLAIFFNFLELEVGTERLQGRHRPFTILAPVQYFRSRFILAPDSGWYINE